MNQGWSFCVRCGHKIAFSALKCPKCGTKIQRNHAPERDLSHKNYGTAVSLCGIFGVVGVHHFYIGNLLHGLFDLGLFIATLVFISMGMNSNNDVLVGLGCLCFFIDVGHTITVFYRLIVGVQRDGKGKLISAPF